MKSGKGFISTQLVCYQSYMIFYRLVRRVVEVIVEDGNMVTIVGSLMVSWK